MVLHFLSSTKPKSINISTAVILLYEVLQMMGGAVQMTVVFNYLFYSILL